MSSHIMLISLGAKECHLLRGNSQRSRACVPLAKRAKHAVLLTGTPLVARPQDAYPLLDGLLNLCSPGDFAQRYGRHLEELHVLLKAVMLRRTKASTLQQLPSKRRQKVLLDMKELPKQEEGPEEASKGLVKGKSALVVDYMSCLVAADAPWYRGCEAKS